VEVLVDMPCCGGDEMASLKPGEDEVMIYEPQ
jgi:hypothetical protein